MTRGDNLQALDGHTQDTYQLSRVFPATNQRGEVKGGARAEVRGLGGWLILLLAFMLFVAWQTTDKFFFHLSTARYENALIDFVYAGLFVLLLYLFFTKRRIFVHVYFYLTLGGVAEISLIAWINGLGNTPLAQTLVNAGGTVLVVTYLLLSKRVRNTFIN